MALKFAKLLKAHVEKMSTFRLSRMLMKPNELNRSFQDVDEKKGKNRKAKKLGRRVFCDLRLLIRGFQRRYLGANKVCIFYPLHSIP
jgi:hypothetical protein